MFLELKVLTFVFTGLWRDWPALCDNFCMFQCLDKLGLSLELGSFAAGVISTSDPSQHMLEQVRLLQLFYWPR